MGEPTDDAIDHALAAGRTARRTQPRATAARYDTASGRIVVDLANGCTFAFPADGTEGLDAATPDQRSAVALLGSGTGLHWEALDLDLSVPALMAGLFGTAAFMARQAGRSTSPAKAAAARANGVKGGRPRRAAQA